MSLPISHPLNRTGIVHREPQRPRFFNSVASGLRFLARRMARSYATRPTVFVVAGYWLTIFAVDFLNDWLLWGIARPLRPWTDVARDVTLWWTTWLPLTPVIIWLARRWPCHREVFAVNLARHLAASLAAVFLHLVVAATTFTFLYPAGPSVSNRLAVWLGGFTLTEFLVYWGLVGLIWLTAEYPETGRSPSARSGRRATHFTVRDDDRIRLVPTEQVDWLEAAGNYVKVHVGKDQFVVRGSLKTALLRLDECRFVQIHRSTVVNVARIKEIQPWFSGDYMAILDTGEQLKISRTYRNTVLAPMI